MSHHRQPVHTLYGGAHLFTSETIPKMGLLATRQLLAISPDCFAFAAGLSLEEAHSLPGTENGRMSLLRRFRRRGEAARAVHPDGWFVFSLYEKVLNKLRSAAIEDYRIDFEDGYGFRGNAQEDKDAVGSATETAHAHTAKTLPPFFGIRIRPMTPEFKERALRTLDLFIRQLLDQSSGRLPDGFVVTLPKVSSVAEVEILARRLDGLETEYGVSVGTVRMELMVEHPRVLTADGNGTVLTHMIEAGGGRVRGLHLGLYDYLSSLGIVGSMQSYRHPSADHLRNVTSVIAASADVWISDGAVNTIPVGPHRGTSLTKAQRSANENAVWSGWGEVYDSVSHSLHFGYYQGWDLHPSQTVARYAAVFALFLREFERSKRRLMAFLEDAARARRDGQEFDDVATGLGLLQFFAKGYACGAFSREELESTGLSTGAIMDGSFSKIVAATKKGAPKGPR